MLNKLKSIIFKHIRLIVTIVLIIIYCLLFLLYVTSYKNIPLWAIIILFIFAIIGTLFACFSFKVALIFNKINTFIFRTNSLNDDENEPSNFAIWLTRIEGIVLIIFYLTPLIMH